MRNRIDGPASMIAGGILVLVSMIPGWITVTLMWQGQVIAQGKLLGSNGALVSGGLVLLAGVVVALTKRGRRTGFPVVAIVASTLIMISVVVSFVRSFGVGSVMETVSQDSSDADRLQRWIEQGATLNTTRSIGLLLAFAGGLLGLAGGVLAVRERKAHARSLLVPPPPMPSPI
jgi:hypothetical protein